MTQHDNRRILIVDDNAAIHQDFRKILLDTAAPAAAALSASEAALFGDEASDAAPAAPATAVSLPEYTLDSASQGAEALERVQSARKEGLPYALVFLDVRMPPGWDGVETARKLWEADADLQIVLCTAYSDYSWHETVAALGRTDRLLILKKPFDRVEVCQLAAALTEKWNSLVRERQSLQTALRAEMEARSYAASLETVNRALESSWAKAESELSRRGEFLLKLASEVLAPAQMLLFDSLNVTQLAAGVASEASALDRLVDPGIAIVSAITNVLELASMEAGVAQAKLASCSPTQIVSQVTQQAAHAARERQVELQVCCAEGLPEQLESDGERIGRILNELVDNALRHSRGGQVQVALDTGVTPGLPGVVLRVLVRDSGAGVAREARARMFEPFNSPDRRRAGLGLAVAKRSAALLGGDLSCEPGEGPGACFALSLPLRDAR